MIFTGNPPACVCHLYLFFSPHSTSHHQCTAQDFALFTSSSISFSYLSSHSFLHPIIPILISFLKLFEKSIFWVILPQFLQTKISALENNEAIFFSYISSVKFRFWLSMCFHSFSSAFLSCQCHGSTTRSFLDSQVTLVHYNGYFTCRVLDL